MSTGPFHRAHSLMTSIATILAQFGSNQHLARQALAALPVYRSRGKGRGKAMQKSRKSNPSGKYRPHQGARECARRVAQMRAGFIAKTPC